MADDPKATIRAAWPDPMQPGVPLHPELDGYHWLRRKSGGLDPWFWEAELGGPGLGGWLEEGGDGAPTDFERAFTYHAPCVPPEVHEP
jgi:hypothetical protein